MYIVCWMTNNNRSYWSAFDDPDNARSEYERLRCLDTIYTVTLSAVVDSTDYPSTLEH